MVKIKVPSLDEIKRREIKEMKRQIKEKLKEVEWDIKAGDYKEALDKLGEIKKEAKKLRDERLLNKILRKIDEIRKK